MKLTLLVPELIWPEPDDPAVFDGLDCPQLAYLLARSQCRQAPSVPLEACLMRLFGRPESSPHAPFRCLGEDLVPPGSENAYWVCADPVHLRFHQDHLLLADGSRLSITPDEAQALLDQLNPYFADLGQFIAATPQRWYLQLSSGYGEFPFPPVSSVAGRSVEGLLPEIAQAGPSSRLINELQTLLYGHPVNTQRDNTGRMTINSLWLSGAGTLPPRIECDLDGVWSLNPLARGLALAAGVPTHPLPVDAATLLTHAAPDTLHLVVLEDTLTAVQYEDGEAYCKALASLDARWFAPLYAALASGKLHELSIESTTPYGAISWQCRRADRWKVWRRPQPLNAVAKQLATTVTGTGA